MGGVLCGRSPSWGRGRSRCRAYGLGGWCGRRCVVACAVPSGARFRCADAVMHQRLFVAGWRRTFGSCCYALPVLFVESSYLFVRSVLVLLRRRKVFICSLLCCSLSLPTILVVVSPAVLAVVLWTPVVSSHSLALSRMCLRVCRCFSQCSHRLNT